MHSSSFRHFAVSGITLIFAFTPVVSAAAASLQLENLRFQYSSPPITIRDNVEETAQVRVLGAKRTVTRLTRRSVQEKKVKEGDRRRSRLLSL